MIIKSTMSEDQEIKSMTHNPAKLVRLIQRLEETLKCSHCRNLPKTSEQLILFREADRLPRHSKQRQTTKPTFHGDNSRSNDSDEPSFGAISPPMFVCQDCWKCCHQLEAGDNDSKSNCKSDKPPPINVAHAMTMSANQVEQRRTPESETVDPFRLLRTLRKLHGLISISVDSATNLANKSAAILPPSSSNQADKVENEKKTPQIMAETELMSDDKLPESSFFESIINCNNKAGEIDDSAAHLPTMPAPEKPVEHKKNGLGINQSSQINKFVIERASPTGHEHEYSKDADEGEAFKPGVRKPCSAEAESLLETSASPNLDDSTAVGEIGSITLDDFERQKNENVATQNSSLLADESIDSRILPESADFVRGYNRNSSQAESISSHLLPQTEDFMNLAMSRRSPTMRREDRSQIESSQEGLRATKHSVSKSEVHSSVSKSIVDGQANTDSEQRLSTLTILAETAAPMKLPLREQQDSSTIICNQAASCGIYSATNSQHIDFGESACDSIATEMLPETADLMAGGTQAPTRSAKANSTIRRKRSGESMSDSPSSLAQTYTRNIPEKKSKQARNGSVSSQQGLLRREDGINESPVDSVRTGAQQETTDFRASMGIAGAPLATPLGGGPAVYNCNLPWTPHSQSQRRAFPGSESLSMLTETYQYGYDTCAFSHTIDNSPTAVADQKIGGHEADQIECSEQNTRLSSSIQNSSDRGCSESSAINDPNHHQTNPDDGADILRGRTMQKETEGKSSSNEKQQSSPANNETQSIPFPVPSVIVTPLPSSNSVPRSSCGSLIVPGPSLTETSTGKHTAPLVFEDDALLEFDRQCLRSLDDAKICAAGREDDYEKLFQPEFAGQENIVLVTYGEVQRNPFVEATIPLRNEVRKIPSVML